MGITGLAITLISLLFLISVLSSTISPRLGIPVLLLYLLVGMLAGEDGLLGIRYDDVLSAHLVGSTALAVILFDGGLRTSHQALRVGLRPALGLATAGVLLTAAITGAVVVWALGVGWLEAMLVGAIVGSTDAAAVFSLLHGRGMALGDRVASTLEIESGANDPMAVFLTIVLVEAIAAGTVPGWAVAGQFLWQMSAGAVLGVLCGLSLAWALTRVTLNPGLYPLLVLFGALFTFGATSLAGGSGFLAAYAAGLTLSGRVSRGLYNVQRFLDGAAWLSQITMFVVLGLLVTPRELVTHTTAGLLVGAVLILIARPLAVFLCLLPFRFPWRERAFIAWVGLRGAVPIILALFPWLAGLPDWQVYFNLAFFVVLMSLVVQGWTVAPLARWLGLEVPSRSGRVQRVELGMPGQEEYELVGYRIEADSPLVRGPPAAMSWPGEVRPVVAIRGREALLPEQTTALQVGDRIYFLARPTELEALDRRIVGEREPERLGERRFFGEFVIRPQATLGELGAVYGFEVEPEAQARTIGALLLERYPWPTVGDRLRMGTVEFVIREVDAGCIGKVGLKLVRTR